MPTIFQRASCEMVGTLRFAHPKTPSPTVYRRVVPANAGTHTPRRLWDEWSLLLCPIEGSRGMGPGVRRDDN